MSLRENSGISSWVRFADSVSLTFVQELDVSPAPVRDSNLYANSPNVAQIALFDNTQRAPVATGDSLESTSVVPSIHQEEMDVILRRLDALERTSARPQEDLQRWTVKRGGHFSLDCAQWAHSDATIVASSLPMSTRLASMKQRLLWAPLRNKAKRSYIESRSLGAVTIGGAV